jgi:hypothetical protein
MIDRCHRPHARSYSDYGAKGIRVCDEWRNDFHTYAQFALSHGWKPELTIERTDYRGDYQPDNCCYMTRKEQSRNQSRNINLTIDGETKCLSEWCEILGFNHSTAMSRYRRGATDPQDIFYKGNNKKRRVEMRSLDGTLKDVFQSIADASRATDIPSRNIREAVRKGGCHRSGQYKWCYAD